MRCKYKHNGKCGILSDEAQTTFYVSDDWCIKHCIPNDPNVEWLKGTIKHEGKDEIYAAVAEMPSVYQMVKNIGKHAFEVVKHWKKTGRVFVTDENRDARLKVCESCVHCKDWKCKLNSCGCHLTGDLGKTRFEVLACPIAKHDIIDERYKE